MLHQNSTLRQQVTGQAPFLPLAFRFGAAFGLIVLQLALPAESAGGPPGEGFYMLCLLVLFGESIWEASHSLKHNGVPFQTPSPAWIRFNLLLDAVLITLLIAFHGVDQERLATIYIFPVLASAFYLRNYEIVGVAILSSAFHITSALLFTYGVIGPFGSSGMAQDLEPSRLAFILGFATLQIFAAAFVVLVIRKNLENLRMNLSQSEATVDELSTMYRRVFESMLSGLITVDLRGRVTSANPAAQKILLRNLDKGVPIEEQGFEDLAKLVDHVKEQRFEMNVRTPGGDTRLIGGNLVPLRNPEAGVTGHLLVFQDLTEIKQLEERTRLTERLAAVGELSSEMAHELRNPMASILGCVQILQQGEQTRPMMDRVLTILGRESERVSAIVTDFLDFTRPRAARIQEIQLTEALENLKASWETDSRCKGLPLQLGPVPNVVILGDVAWVHQVFINLLSNARKALKGTSEPVIRIGFEHKASSLTITFEDNGCGMSEARLRTIFMPFSSGFEEGNGLGMSLVFQFIQQMKWSIQVESSLGDGTTVTLTIPLGPRELFVPAGTF